VKDGVTYTDGYYEAGYINYYNDTTSCYLEVCRNGAFGTETSTCAYCLDNTVKKAPYSIGSTQLTGSPPCWKLYCVPPSSLQGEGTWMKIGAACTG